MPDSSVGQSGASLSNMIGELSIDIDAKARQAEAVASHASFVGSEQQVDDLLAVATELRAVAKEVEALR